MDDYKQYTIRASSILTGSYVAGTIIGDANIIYEKNQLVLLVDFTKGSLTSATIKVEFSPDNTTYYQETLDNPDYTTGIVTEVLATRTLTATGKYTIPIPIKYRWIKVSAIGTGTTTDSLLSIIATIGVV